MKQIRPHRPSHATVVAYLALFIALSGTALAASKIKSNDIAKNAVTTKKIKKKAVTEDRLADGAVTTSKIAGLAVTSSKLADDSVSSGKLESDSVASGKIQKDAVTQGKIADGAVTAGKVTGPLGLDKVAAVVADVSPSVGLITDLHCGEVDVAVAGAQVGDRALALARSGFNPGLFVTASTTAANSVALWFCNFSGGSIAAAPEPVQIALFR